MKSTYLSTALTLGAAFILVGCDFTTAQSDGTNTFATPGKRSIETSPEADTKTEGASCGILGTCGTSAPTTCETKPVSVPASDKVVVTVNGKELLKSEADVLIGRALSQQGVPPNMVEQFSEQMGPQLLEQVIEEFIGVTLLAQEAKEMKISISDETVSETLEKMSENLPEGMTLKEAVSQSGGSLEELKAEVIKNLEVKALFESQASEVKEPTDEEVKAFYTENSQHFETKQSCSAKHILLKTEEDASEEDLAKTKAEAIKIRKLLMDGGDFAELAKEHSDCPSKEKGGDLGNFEKGQMVPEFSEAAFTQEIDSIGEIVKTDFGYHIIVVTERAEPGTTPFSEVKEEIKGFLKMRAQDDLFQAYIQTLKSKATIAYAEGLEPKSE